MAVTADFHLVAVVPMGGRQFEVEVEPVLVSKAALIFGSDDRRSGENVESMSRFEILNQVDADDVFRNKIQILQKTVGIFMDREFIAFQSVEDQFPDFLGRFFWRWSHGKVVLFDTLATSNF